MFKVHAPYKPIDVQEQAAQALSEGIAKKMKNQVLLGVTGSGKTFTMAQVIQKTQMPALIISHNKTLAGQLYQEIRDFFPENAVSYFVSYYDYYQPEAYIPQTDTYIEKEAQINQTIDRLRLASTSNILTRTDPIVVASVSCIYNIGSPLEYGKFILELKVGGMYDLNQIKKRLIELQYVRNEYDFKRGSFRVRGSTIDIYPAAADFGYRVKLDGESITSILKMDPLIGEKIGEEIATGEYVFIYPAKQYMTDPALFESAEIRIRADLEKQYNTLKKDGKEFEATRLLKKVNYDLEMLSEMGYVNGIENYSSYFDGRAPGQPPFTLLDYFKTRFGRDWLVFIDESHMTVPQIRGMYNGDQARKKTLIEYGFRLPSALDNRPLQFSEFYNQIDNVVYVSATPNEWEIEKAQGRVIEQLVRPTGIVDPQVSIRPAKTEIPDLLVEIKKRVEKKERVLVASLTKRIAEDLTSYLKEQGIKTEYLHSDIKTLDRSEILHKLRSADFDVLVGINLLREGIDLPEVSLVAILDADNEGFLRSKTAIIQTMGRAARNSEGEIIIYADTITKSITAAVDEVDRRRNYQVAYNKEHNITPKTIFKEIKEDIIKLEEQKERDFTSGAVFQTLIDIKPDNLTPQDKSKLIEKLRKEMRKQAQGLHFEAAIAIREKMKELE
ncbi:excinuclease ABC subunit B [Candidatus Roizmanbacteria bacterium RIFCSPHIGHO2_02_FULL_40_13b]|uniref:UvrABC system protein B n=1 Tax=Candidatus Roizmanbacteria bacterium RIFCSPHIGHO2_01_FULL_39_24 TaxID=1802032 RepID=A0A1F7GF35_9BACT|nr:MAG: excinuclease ABC subunit B [Candidatus Roizmanbacteria bacterium RIFCSPHIGHO2_01_FULL_39_24]OGK26740.1 MAG: excinuclease ABC subunit B [Candidatus Roizmanbacteria bacterium RIFCSPHIGHO2_02_FULL_40_13b]OGK48966.1 MAG: excinuclease ABC subunit B [Candidatus Roizmanbacteria bacterium RIFCSPLOWO2_01_FULL_40_32]OGK56302.1 MAG: excinuclease ABC subunit B [Candidatus Roizmanbacteria bacterium RIFCSPLOWO2_02_FULL_39_8]